MIVIYRAQNLIEAHIVAGMLRAHDIEVIIAGEYLNGAIGELPPMNLIEVTISEESINLATTLIEQYESPLGEFKA